eukprot:1156535-Pelagomonas_calceolata.AAC.9
MGRCLWVGCRHCQGVKTSTPTPCTQPNTSGAQHCMLKVVWREPLGHDDDLHSHPACKQTASAVHNSHRHHPPFKHDFRGLCHMVTG